MKPTCKILIGAPLSGDEARFLRRLYGDLSDVEALILANFIAGKRQIDFVVVTRDHTAILELKNFPLPVFGEKNGTWTFEDSSGKRVPYAGANAYQQTVQQKYALSDEMQLYRAKNTNVPGHSGKGYYENFDAYVCIFPAIHERSQVTEGDHKALVRSYADVIEALRSGVKSSSWTLDHWEEFAERHLKLDRVSLEEAVDEKVRHATDTIRIYRARLRSVFGTYLPPLIVTSGEQSYGTALIASALDRRNHLFMGPSGAGKTFHTHHLVLALADSDEEMPLFVEARAHTGGDFRSAFRTSLAMLCNGGPKELLLAMQTCGVKPVLIVDALNECDEASQQTLLQGIGAFMTRFGGRVVLTSQMAPTLPADLDATSHHVPLPDVSQKRAIYAHHAGLVEGAELDLFCTGFSNAYELTVAGRCHQTRNPPTTRSELYDRYVRRNLPSHTAVATGLLRNLAAMMGSSLSTFCDRDAFEITAERFLQEHEASLAILDEIRESRLVRLSDEFFSFEHELLFDYFKAESLRREHAEISKLAEELRRPRNQDLIEFILPRFVHTEDIARLLSEVRDPRLLLRVAAGYCGSSARTVLFGQCRELLRIAAADLPNVRIECELFTRQSGSAGIRHVVATPVRQWTAYDASLCHVIASFLADDGIRKLFFELFDQTEWTLRAEAKRAAANAHVSAKHVWEETVRLYGGIVQHGTMRLPCSSVLTELRSAWMHREWTVESIVRDELLRRANRSLRSDFALLMLLEDRARTADPDFTHQNLELVEDGLRSGVYILGVIALEYLQLMASTIHERFPELSSRVTELLEGIDTSNIMLNTLVLETMTSFDVLSPPVSDENAEAEMRNIVGLRRDDERIVEIAATGGVDPTQLLASFAYGSLCKIFEDVFQGAYYRAYASLNNDEKEAILILAAGAETGFFTDWILQELLRHGSRRALQVYRRFAGGVDVTNCFTQDSVAAFVLGIRGCARFTSAPPTYTRGDSPEDRAWKTIAEILFYKFRGEHERSASLWARFDEKTRLATADILYQLSHSTHRLGDDDRTALDLVGSCSEQIRPIVEECLNARESLPSLIPHGGSADRSVIRFLLRSLAKIGNSSSLVVLRQIVDDPEFGSEAIEAIESIEKSSLERRLGTPANA